VASIMRSGHKAWRSENKGGTYHTSILQKSPLSARGRATPTVVQTVSHSDLDLPLGLVLESATSKKNACH
jgi:hypothetical protein